MIIKKFVVFLFISFNSLFYHFSLFIFYTLSIDWIIIIFKNEIFSFRINNRGEVNRNIKTKLRIMQFNNRDM